MSLESLLPGEVGEASGLRYVAVIERNEHHFHIEIAQPDEAKHVVETHCSAAGFPPSHDGLCGFRTVGQLTLGERGAAPGFSDQIARVSTHAPT